ncbi:MAG TPA: hypothetical protein VGK32_11830 [Vicinamibacterales bacterium]|jgi:hypothetical protein
MLRRPKSKLDDEVTPETLVSPPQADGVADMVEGLFDLLASYQAEPNEGVLSLLTAFLHGAHRVLEASAAEDAEHNRAALLALLDQARRAIEEWPQETPEHWSVH